MLMQRPVEHSWRLPQALHGMTVQHTPPPRAEDGGRCADHPGEGHPMSHPPQSENPQASGTPTPSLLQQRRIKCRIRGRAAKTLWAVCKATSVGAGGSEKRTPPHGDQTLAIAVNETVPQKKSQGEGHPRIPSRHQDSHLIGAPRPMRPYQRSFLKVKSSRARHRSSAATSRMRWSLRTAAMPESHQVVLLGREIVVKLDLLNMSARTRLGRPVQETEGARKSWPMTSCGSSWGHSCNSASDCSVSVQTWFVRWRSKSSSVQCRLHLQ
mmetsp:Transcript_26189/g.61099  ORF Transcript_26189/g.61099 Transcript_26189/m.61099 type:complete len:268 (-) Transcript_26189:715-1518(-)